MGLNVSKGNMYGFVTHTWNAIKGKCEFDCSYCYMKRWGNLNPARLDQKEFKEFDNDIKKYGNGNFIFVGSSIDMWSESIPLGWIKKILSFLYDYPDNKYLFQSKDPKQFIRFIEMYPELFGSNIVFATTIESNWYYPEISKAPAPLDRALYIEKVHEMGFETMVTVEPVLDFDLKDFTDILLYTKADQINIGAVTGGHKLPEPSKEKLAELIMAIKPHLKSNINRLI